MTSAIEGNEGRGLRFSLEKVPGPTDGSGRLHMRFNYTGFNYTGVNRFFMSLPAGADEQIYGGGEQYNALNLNGNAFDILVNEQGVGRGDNLVSQAGKANGDTGRYDTSYWSMPVFITEN